MNQRIKLLLTAIFALAILFTTSQAQVTLRVGAPAPEIKHYKWVKGTPVTNFEKGKFYVVEFWATWCPPCKTSIPHLTELAHKYKDKVTFIGMDGSEHVPFGPEADKLVEDFVKEYGDKMDYCVAMDTKEKFMMNNWMTAAAQYGIPTAFVVDKDKKIAWIGHPMEMEEPLAQILDGKFEAKAYTEKFSADQDKSFKAREEQKKFAELTKSISEAMRAKDYAKAVAECEALVAKDPTLQSKLDFNYFKALIKVNPDKAMSIAKEEKTKNSDRLITICQAFAQKEQDKKFYSFVVDALAPKVEKDANDYSSLSILANTYEFIGNNAKAIEMIEKIIVYAKAQGAGDDYVKSMNERIEKLKAVK